MGEHTVIVRQGDVLLVRVEELPEEAIHEPASGRLVLAEGEATGHAHAITSRRATLHCVTDWEEERYLVVEGVRPVFLTHEEHDRIGISPGVWEIRRQREYDPGSARWVTD